MTLWQLRVEQENPRTRLLATGQWLVGADESCDVRLDHRTVSRRHARLTVTEEQLIVEDLDSKNGTWVDEQRLESPHEATASFIVGFGAVRCRLSPMAPEDAETGVALSAGESSADFGRAAHHSLHGSPAETAIHEPVLEWFAGALPDLVQRCAGRSRLEAAAMVGSEIVGLPPITSLQIEADDGEILFDDVTSGATDVPELQRRLSSGDLTVHLGVAPEQDPGRLAYTALAAVSLLAQQESEEVDTPAELNPPPLPEPATRCPGLLRIYQRAARAAHAEINCLVLGSTGTGKEVLARYLHRSSPRADRPFVAINCASLPKDLLEAELFGVERGVATGVDARAGCFERAHGGTLFLDEIGDMPLVTQAMILRVLQEKQTVRIGGSRAVDADVWVVSATNRNLTEARHEGNFREDLWYRLAGWSPQLPDLRDRPEDIASLAGYFAGNESRRMRRRIRGLSRGTLTALRRCPWPGNVRQLQQEMHRAVAFADPGGLIDTQCLSEEVLRAAEPSDNTLAARLEWFERREIERALNQCELSVADAAELLGTTRSTLYRRIKKLGIELEAER